MMKPYETIQYKIKKKDFNSQSLATQSKKKREQIASMMPAFKKTLSLTGDNVGDFSAENENLRKKGSYDEKWLEESKARPFKFAQ